MDKTAIKNFSIWARVKLIKDISYKAGLLGVKPEGLEAPLPQSTDSVLFFDIGAQEPYSITEPAIGQRKALVQVIESKAAQSDYKTAYETVIEEVAYTWFNRLIAIRFMEVNGYLPTGVRVLSSESPGKLEPDLVTHALEADLGYTGYEKDRIAQLKHENKLDELFSLLFIKQCNALNKNLPELFERTNDYTELLFNVSFTDPDGLVRHLVEDIGAGDFDVSQKGQVEIIGWLYQYYNTEPKQAVFDGLKKNIKITKEKIPAATQLFTPHWIVRYMVENSLGRLFIVNSGQWLVDSMTESERIAKEKEIAEKFGWKYYVPEAEQSPEVRARLEVFSDKCLVSSEQETNHSPLTTNFNIEDIKLIDPCMGSGHILVYAFDVLMQIYASEGYTPRDAAKLILQKNLYGLDIDKRAYQLAYFSLMMKGRRHNRRLLSEGLSPQVYHPAGYPEGEEYGSLVKVDSDRWSVDSKPVKPEVFTLFDEDYETALNAWNFKRLLAQKYDVVVTNPPYMAPTPAQADWVKKNYPDSKSDLFAVFIEKCGELLNTYGYQAMITQHSWMFLSSYEKLRAKLMLRDIVNMAHLGARAFQEIGGEVVQTTSFVLAKNKTADFKGTYVRLVDYNSQDAKEEAFLSALSTNHSPLTTNLHTANTENFEKIPGSPVAYWVSEAMLRAFDEEKLIGDIADVKIGMGTGKNNVFVREWWEVEHEKIDFSLKNVNELDNSAGRYFPYNKGGEYRLWYGNLQQVLWFDSAGRNNMNTMPGHRENGGWNFYFKQGLTWSFISSSKFGVRFLPFGFTFDVAGSTLFIDDRNIKYVLGFLTSAVCFDILSLLNPTLNYQAGNIKSLPIKLDNNRYNEVTEIVDDNISQSRTDWDSFEISWDFKRHPLV